ncbi:MAG: LEA type 2 family protein [Balneolaceae bacterium]
MMYKKISTYLFLALLLSSCSELKKITDVKKPTISVDDFRITEISLRDIELTFDLELINPNPIALSLASYDYDLQIEQNSFVKGNQSLTTKIEANGSIIISIPVKFTFDELYNTISNISSKKEGGYAFVGNIGVNVPVLGLVEVPIEKEGVFPIVKAPSFSLSSFSVKNLSFTKADVELEINIGNPNTFALILDKLDYNIQLNGFDTINGGTTSSLSIAENEIRSLKIPASFNFLELGSAAYSTIVGGEPFQYSLTGSADVGASLPNFDLSSFNFDRSGVVDILK